MCVEFLDVLKADADLSIGGEDDVAPYHIPDLPREVHDGKGCLVRQKGLHSLRVECTRTLDRVLSPVAVMSYLASMAVPGC